jgi:hypothetical protein
MRARCWTLAIAVSIAAPATVHAQPEAPAQADVHARADEQFRQGRAAMESQDHAKALELLRASHAAEPGRGKLLNIAICEEALGQLASALTHFNDLSLQLPQDDDRLPLVRKSIAGLLPRVPYLHLVFADGARLPDDLRVTLDGEVLLPLPLTADIPMDVGTHAVVLTGAGIQSATHQVIAERGKRAVLYLELRPVAAAPSYPLPAATPSFAFNRPPAPRPPLPDQSRKPSWSKWLGGTLLGIAGLAGVGVGAGLGVLALSKQSESDAHCDLFYVTLYCDPEGIELRTTSKDAGLGATLGLMAGGVFLGSSVILVARAARAPDRPPALTTSLAVGPGGALVVGTW